MVDHELIERVTRLPVSQRLELIERLTHSLREELAAPQIIETEDAVNTVNLLFGILRTDAPLPTDEELREEYTNYLTQKYS